MPKPRPKVPRRRPSLTASALVVASALAACGTPPPPAEARAAAAGPAFASAPLYQDGAPWPGPETSAMALHHAQVLTGHDPRFGGWSGVAVAPGAEGTTLLAVSDRGFWLRAVLDDATGKVSPSALGRLPGRDGTPLLDNNRRDAEDLVLLSNGAAIVSFEREHRLWLYPPPATPGAVAFTAGPPIPLPLPPDLDQAPENGGMEAATLLPDGRLAVLVEGANGADAAQGWLGRPSRPFAQAAAEGQAPEIDWRPFRLALDGDHRPTGAAADASGLYVIERAFSIPLGFRNRLCRIPLSALEEPAPDTPLGAEVLLTLDRPPVTDNFEALAIHPLADGRHRLMLMSDDNFNGLQRTILLELTMPAALRPPT